MVVLAADDEGVDEYSGCLDTNEEHEVDKEQRPVEWRTVRMGSDGRLALAPCLVTHVLPLGSARRIHVRDAGLVKGTPAAASFSKAVPIPARPARPRSGSRETEPASKSGPIDAVTTAPREEPIPLRTVERWLLALQFIRRAEEAAGYGAAVDHTIALILADTATESLLALLADAPGVTPSGEKFPSLLSAAMGAIVAAGIDEPPGLRNAIVATHKRRNAAIHDGIETIESDTAIESARRLLALLPRATRLPDLPAGAMLLGAIAELVAPASDVAHWLRSADEHARAERWAEAAQAGAKALLVAREQSVPHIELKPSEPAFFRTDVPRDLQPFMQGIFVRLRRLESWFVPLGLGLRATDYEAMQDTLGDAWWMSSDAIMTNTPSQLDGASVTHALDLLADVIVRLWTTGAMYRGPLANYHDARRRGRRQR